MADPILQQKMLSELDKFKADVDSMSSKAIAIFSKHSEMAAQEIINLISDPDPKIRLQSATQALKFIGLEVSKHEVAHTGINITQTEAERILAMSKLTKE